MRGIKKKYEKEEKEERRKGGKEEKKLPDCQVEMFIPNPKIQPGCLTILKPHTDTGGLPKILNKKTTYFRQPGYHRFCIV